MDEIQPKEDEIEMLGGRLKSVKGDLLKEKKDNNELERNIDKMDELIKHLKKENEDQDDGNF